MEGIPEKLLLCCQRFLLPSVGSSDPDLSCSFPPGLAGQAVAAALAPPSGGRGERGRPVTSEGGGALLGGSPWTRSGVACPLRSVCFVFIQASKQNALHLPQTFRFSIACQVCFFLVGSIFIFNAILFLTFKLQGGHRVPGPVCACGLCATLSGPRFPHLSSGEINSEV